MSPHELNTSHKVSNMTKSIMHFLTVDYTWGEPIDYNHCHKPLLSWPNNSGHPYFDWPTYLAESLFIHPFGHKGQEIPFCLSVVSLWQKAMPKFQPNRGSKYFQFSATNAIGLDDICCFRFGLLLRK